MTIFFTSDTHIGHKNIIKYSNRPYKSIEEMNEAIVNNWNSLVTQDDTVYHLGDVGFINNDNLNKYLNRLNGKIYHIIGNHDKKLRTDRFEWSRHYFELKIQDKDCERGSQLIILCHYPFLTWDRKHHNSWNIHGHCHGSIPVDLNTKRIDAGVDVWNYYPISYQVLKNEFKKFNNPIKDHHNNYLED
jgi:calcineurin-like phosphoesterase family protein